VRISSSLLALSLLAPLQVGANDPAVNTSPESSNAARAELRRGGPAMDRLELESTAITGNRELPKVMSIVPWKAAEPPSGPDRPMGSLIEELLSPLDPAEFRREITYFRDLTEQSTQTIAGQNVSADARDRRSVNNLSSPGATTP
jgi:hypothetical protein